MINLENNKKIGESMKNILFSFVAASVLMLSGCSQKNPTIDNGGNSNGQVVIDSQSQGNMGMNAGVMDVNQIIAKLKSELGTVYFNFDSFSIRPDMQQVVANGANILSQKDASNLTIKLEGNCDEWGTDEYNMALGLKRASSVKQALVSRGINPNSIQTVSYGKNNPVCNEKTKSCWAQNRRVNFDLLP